MFMKNEEGYNSLGKVIEKIIIDQEYSSSIRFCGNFKACDKLLALHEGVLGDITVFSDEVLVREKAITSGKLENLLNIMEKYEPALRTIREELLSVNKTSQKKLNDQKKTKSFGYSSILTDLHQDITKPNKEKKDKMESEASEGSQDNQKKRIPFDLTRVLLDLDKSYEELGNRKKNRMKDENPKAYQDLRNMYVLLSEDSFADVVPEVIVSESCRTVNAHYTESHPLSPDCSWQEDICRTTITAPGYDGGVAYIEYRTTPERYYEHEEKTVAATHKWIIEFNSEEAAQKYDHCMRGFSSSGSTYSKSSCTLQDSPYSPIENALNSLIKEGACPELAAQQHKEQLESSDSLNLCL